MMRRAFTTAAFAGAVGALLVLPGCASEFTGGGSRTTLAVAAYCPPDLNCPVMTPGWEGMIVSDEGGVDLVRRKAKICPNGAGCPAGSAGYFKGRLFKAPTDMVVCRGGGASPCPSNLGPRVAFLCPVKSSCAATLKAAFREPETD